MTSHAGPRVPIAVEVRACSGAGARAGARTFVLLVLGALLTSPAAAAGAPPIQPTLAAASDAGLDTPSTSVDDAGRSVRLRRPPQRVVALAPNLAELVHAAGGGDRLVGAVALSDYPEAVQSLPRVGDSQRLDVERVLSLRPDLVLVWHHGNNGRELAQLEAAGLPLFYLEPRTLDELPRAIERLGTLLGRSAVAEPAARALRQHLQALRTQHANAAPVSVFYQVWPSPLMTLNGEHLISEVISLCGGRNVFAGLGPLVPQVSTESVVAADPEVMLVAREDSGDSGEARRAAGHPAFAAWSRHGQMTAVRRGWMFSLSGDHISRQGPRIVQGAQALCGVLDAVRRERPGLR
jgi:iron complex transport system substrate-binding protein